MPHTSDVIAQKLYDHGCRYAFGIPGGEVLIIMDALARVGTTFVLAKHENAAGFMAEGAHHATFAPVILLAVGTRRCKCRQCRGQRPPGSGAADRPDGMCRCGGSLDLHPSNVRSPSRTATDHQSIVSSGRRSIRHSGRQGGCDCASGPTGSGSYRPSLQRRRRVPSIRNQHIARAGDPNGTRRSATSQARALFRRSIRPIMVVGIDAIHEAGAGVAICTFVERFQIPFLTTYNAKGRRVPAFSPRSAPWLDALARGEAAPARTLRSDAPVLREQLKSIFGAKAGASGPHVAIDTIQKAMPRDTVVTADSGAHRILLSQQWEAYRERGILQSSALCTMGCALPLAIGYQFASPATPVVAFMGDAGLEMVLGELATMRDLKLPLIVCVFVDASMTLIEMKQRSSQLPTVGVDLARPISRPWRALGGYGVFVNTAELLNSAIQAALERKDCFTLMAIDIGPKAYEGRIYWAVQLPS